MRPFLSSQIVEELCESSDQVAFGEQKVDGEADIEDALQLVHPFLYGPDMLVLFRIRLTQEISHADGNNRAINGAAFAMLLQQFQEARPRGPVDLWMAVLRRVATGRVEKHRLVGEPPVAVSGSPDAPDLVVRTELVAQGEMQSGIDRFSSTPKEEEIGRIKSMSQGIVWAEGLGRVKAEELVLIGMREFVQDDGGMLDELTP